MKYIILISVAFYICECEWFSLANYLTTNTKFTYSEKSDGYLYSNGFIVPNTWYQTAPFINCSTPTTSYITINTSFPQAQYYQQIKTNYTKYFVSFDLYYQGTWNGESVQYVFNTVSNSYTHTTANQFNVGFCDSTLAEVKTFNFTFDGPLYGLHQFTLISTNFVQVSLRNVMLSGFKCYPSCYTCNNESSDQCTSCYFSTPTNGVCPGCPSNKPYYVKHTGCREICQIYSSKYQKGFCQTFNNYIFVQTIFSSTSQTEFYKWQVIYDKDHVDTSPKILSNGQYYFYGFFQYKSGLGRYISELTTTSYALPVTLKMDIMMCQPIPIGGAIIVKFNNTYYGSIYQDASGIKSDKIQFYYYYSVSGYNSFTNCKYYETYLYVDIPQYPFFFTIIGNFTDSSFAWGLKQLDINSGYCPSYCLMCKVKFKCETCSANYYLTKDNMCSSCKGAYQFLVNNVCVDYDKETQYSQFLVQEYIGLVADPNQYSQYILESQSGTNFLRGDDIYFTVWNNFRIFGGPFIWAQAKFSRVHNILQPHHSVTIGFYIIFGPTFSVNSKFIYTIETNTPVENFNTNFTKNYTDSSKENRVYEKISHNTNTLTISWECQGADNEPIYAYCGFYYYYVAVHYCQPYCLECTDEITCTTWDTYDSSIIKLSASDCQFGQYYDDENLACILITCPDNCQSCSSPQDCLVCYDTFTLTKKGCECQKNQYEFQNQCFTCPIECNQCTSANSCTECISNVQRILQNNQCVCSDGYYSSTIPNCESCHSFCQSCYGAGKDNCYSCNIIPNIQLNGNTCDCALHTYYEKTQNACVACHYTCLTCFSTTLNSCLSCAADRILKGLICSCAPGYYESGSTCQTCPISEDSTLTSCYKTCGNAQVWHTNNCGSCSSGYQLLGDCQPICGDGLIVGYEQCEDGNNIFDDGCYNCQFQCPKNCVVCNAATILPCSDICGDGQITGTEECDDGNTIQYDGCYNCKYQCQTQCTRCVQGQCLECLTKGWFLDPTQTPWQCKERCGDGWQVGAEQCDDANTIDTDGCKDCKYFCRIGCVTCNYLTNKCLACQQQGTVPQNYYCINVCGDGLLIKDPYGFFEEQCDDGNTINYDGCSSTCRFQCQPATICTLCDINQKCLQCSVGYQLNSNSNRCEPICFDNLQVELEICEDSLQLPYKGCLDCKPKCQSSCQTCSTLGIGCLECKVGYTLIDNLCYSICGDSIVTLDEDCDDGNLIYGDGCHQCQYRCQDSCLYCIKGQCFECKDGFVLHKSLCVPICTSLQYQFYSNNIICTLQIQKCVSNCQLCLFGVCQICNEGYYFDAEQECSKDTFNIQQSNLFELVVLMKIDCNNQKMNQNFINFKEEIASLFQYQFKRKQVSLKCWEQSSYKIDEPMNTVQLNSEEENIFHICSTYIMHSLYKYIIDLQNYNCLSCSKGYYYDELNAQCNPICRDMLDKLIQKKILNQNFKIDEEDCDDNNLLPFDGCFLDNFICSQNCINCKKGICIECNDGFLPADNHCIENLVYQVSEHDLNNLYDSQEDQILEIYNEYSQFLQVMPTQLIIQVEQQRTEDNQCFEENFYQYVEQCQSQEIGYCQLQFKLEMCFETIQIFNLNLFTELQLIDKQKQCKENEIFDQYFGCQLFDDEIVDLICDSQCSVCLQGECLLCNNGWQLNSNLNCETICGDQIIVGQEECDDGNIAYNDGCHECKYQCPQNCEICIKGICEKCESNYEKNYQFNICIEIQQNSINFDIVEDQQTHQIVNDTDCLHQPYFQDFPKTYVCKLNSTEQLIQCPNDCHDCVLGTCTICNKGYYLDIISNTCNSLCGDKVVAGYIEVCDDGNEDRYDGCYQCQFQCQIECLDCQFGKCFECSLPLIVVEELNNCQTQTSCIDQIGLYYDEFSNKCLSECGDGITAGLEQCDDANNIKYDGCYQCSYQCVEFCFDCLKGKCQKCQIGYELEEFVCITKCGDGVVAGKEKCDDGNNIPRDGCTECMIDDRYQCLQNGCFKCQDDCTDCEQNSIIQCNTCEKGYFLIDNACIPCSGKCEECKKTPNNCAICVMEDCKWCDENSGLYFDAATKSCISMCGDGILALNEQCDDNNLIDQDGCNSKCIIENGFQCQDSICYSQPKKHIEFSYLNSTSTNEIELLFVDIDSKEACLNLEVWIEYFEKTEFNYTKSLGEEKCELEFQFYRTILQQNLIHVLIKYEESRLLEKTQEIIIVPRKVVYYTEAQYQQAQEVAQQTNNLTFLLQLIGPLTILLGGLNIFWSILDILTWVNNFYFINVDFPLNVKLLFNHLQWSDIFSIPDIISLNQPEDPYYFEAPTKFTEKDVNPMFLNNIQLFVALVVIALTIYILVDLILRIDSFCKVENPQKKNVFQIFSLNPNFSEQVSPSKKLSYIKENKVPPKKCRLVQILIEEATEFKKNFKAILFKIVDLVFLDVCLACCLQLLYTPESNYFIVHLNYLLAIGSLCFVGYIFYIYNHVCIQHEELLKSSIYECQYAPLYEGINLSSSIAKRFCFINLVRKALFIFCTVFFYYHPLIQTCTCCLTCFLNLAVMCYGNPFESKQEFLRAAIPDACIFCIVFITVLLSWHDVSDILSFEQKYFLGWLILFFLGLSIFIQLVFLLKEFASNLKERASTIKDIFCK